MYDKLEVLFIHKPGCNKDQSLLELQQAISPKYEVEGMDFFDDGQLSNCRQIVRIAAIPRETFTSTGEFEAMVRKLAPEAKFHWQRICGVPVGKLKR